MNPLALLRPLWGIWLLSWILGAVWSSRTVARQPAKDRLAHNLLVLAGSALLFSRLGGSGLLGVSPTSRSHAVAWVGVALTFLGLAFTWWARIHLGRNWSGTVTLKAEHELIRSGPYRLTRHPIYTGLILAVAGTALATDTLGGWLGLGLIALGFVLKLKGEERLLTEHFGEAYRAYQAEVPQLIPGMRDVARR